ncbi:MAG: lipopolysaccharide heptosyltransferase II [Campylobacterota bacterium]|nr:lipopolysaccharide heptosyltransferase II [Campylobacterota bacterium]
MKIFIEIPTWLGDATMATPAIENIVTTYPDAKLTIFGSFISTRLFVHHPNVEKIIVDESKKKGFRYSNLYQYAKNMGSFDMALSFRRNFTTQFLLFFMDAKAKYRYRRYTDNEIHQVIRYNDFINRSLALTTKPSKLKIYTKIDKSAKGRPLLGINAGATYGSAKRWYPKEFAACAIELSHKYDIILFGSPAEKEMVDDIEEIIASNGVDNYQNLAGQTSIEELIEKIASLELFISNDSGPMHLAAAFGVPTVAIFGPTRYTETNQWMNKHSIIMTKNLACAPCMKRTCPLKHHECMKLITADMVIDSVKQEGLF